MSVERQPPPLPAEGPYDDIRVRPKNWLVPVTLAILREESASYGYELMRRLKEEFGFEGINTGTFYRSLRKMEQDGLCGSRWDVASAGPARRVYSITEAGEAHLDLWVESLKLYRRTIDSFFQAYRRRSSSGSEQTDSETP